MAAQDVIKQLIHEFETLLATCPFDLPRAREMASRWCGPDSPIVQDTALDQKLFSLESAHTEYEAKLLVRDILNLAEKEIQ